MNKVITIVNEETNNEVAMTVTTKTMQSTLLRIASISGLKAIVQPDPNGDDAEDY